LLDNANPGAVLNLGDVSLVGAEVVRFLANCEKAGIELVDQQFTTNRSQM
jgi:hypothetical protein